MEKPRKVKARRVNYTTNPIINRAVQGVRICPNCNNVLLYGQYVCDKCGNYYLNGLTNIKEE